MAIENEGNEHVQLPARRHESMPVIHRVLRMLQSLRNTITDLTLPKGLTSDLEEQILELFRQKMEDQKIRCGYILKSQYPITADICMREAMHELLPDGADRRVILCYLLRKVKR